MFLLNLTELYWKKMFCVFSQGVFNICNVAVCIGLSCGAVCVYPNRVIDCVESLKAAGASHIPIASGTFSQ